MIQAKEYLIRVTWVELGQVGARVLLPLLSLMPGSSSPLL